MKSALFLMLCYIVASQAMIKNEIKSYQLECVEETKVDSDLVIQFNAGNIWKKHFPELKKWVLCVLRKSRLMSAQGVFQLDVALTRIPITDRIAGEALIDKCLSTTALPPEEIAWNYVKCLGEKDRKHDFPTLTIV